MSDLPDGWTCTTIKELAGTTGLFVDGDWIESKDQDPNGNIRLLQLADIGDSTFLDKSDRWINEDAFVRLRCTELSTGDVLVARMPDPLGRACLMPALEQRCVTVVDVAALRVDSENIDNRWVMQTINSPQIRAEIAAQSSGTTRRRISRGRLGEMEIPLPPKAEQTRIANQLDTLLTRVQACNDRFDAIPALLKRFRQTVLDAALNGASWAGAAVAESELPKVSISTIASVGTGSTPLRSNNQFFASSGTPWITSSATSAAVVTSANEFVTPAAISAHRLKLFPKGTLLVAMYGEGKTRGQVAELGIAATINQACAAVVVNESKAVRAYVKLALQANYVNMRELAEGGNQPNLNLSKVKEFEIPLPSLADQTEIVRRVEALFALADRIEARCTAARAQAQRLTPLVLAKAFRGELVPQDPNDEPASALLACIASSDTAVAGKNRQKVPVAFKERAQPAINL